MRDELLKAQCFLVIGKHPDNGSAVFQERLFVFQRSDECHDIDEDDSVIEFERGPVRDLIVWEINGNIRTFGFRKTNGQVRRHLGVVPELGMDPDNRKRFFECSI
jgi:hypothetical protein